MSTYVSISASSIKSEELKTTIPGAEFKQSNILFGSGVAICFANALSGVTDIHAKNYSNFYLTNNTQLGQILSEVKSDIKPTKITTTLQQGTNNFVSVAQGETDLLKYIDTKLGLFFSQEIQDVNNQFTIDLIDNKYCTVSYDDNTSTRYIVVDNGDCKLKRAPLIVSNEHYFRYILNGNNLVLLYDNSGNTSIITSNAGKLSAVNFTQHVFNNILENAFTISTKVGTELPDFIDQQYISYSLSGLNISADDRISNLNNNYLLSRNHNNSNLYDIMLLKNQTSEVGEVGVFNTLGLANDNTAANYRTYTSLNRNIDQLEDTTLSLNYVCYNQSFVIVPGINRFTTSDTLFPFSVLNVNDTTFIANGAFGSSTPKYADKVYKEQINNIGESATYLCTWLSYNQTTDTCTWLDRYYYPNLTTKEQTLTASIYNNTFESYVEKLINSNLGLKTNVAETQYFDKLSDFAFEPSASYVYDRIDIDNIDFFTSKNSVDTSINGYYPQINRNNGFTLGFYINQYAGTDFITLYSKFNSIEGGLKVEYNNDTIIITVTFYNSVASDASVASSDLKTRYNPFTKTISLPARSKNSVVCHVDNNIGEVKVFLNEDNVINEVIEPLTYNVIVYGDFVVNDQPLKESSNYLSDVFLSLAPLTSEELELLVTKYNTIYNTYSISLPCGMRNRTDNVKHINILESSNFSKSNTFDVFLNGLEVSNSDRDELIQTIKAELVDVMPLNATINTIEIL
jgi:hypothetical protein